VGRLEGILNEILSFVKETRIIKETVDANKLVDEVVALIESEIDDKNIFIIKELGNTVDVFVDPNRIKDAFLNILKNAVQAVGSNGTESVKPMQNSTRVFEFRDSCRHSEADLFIFDPYYKEGRNRAWPYDNTQDYRGAWRHRGGE
jgi:signal transduction histidine kinase